MKKKIWFLLIQQLEGTYEKHCFFNFLKKGWKKIQTMVSLLKGHQSCRIWINKHGYWAQGGSRILVRNLEKKLTWFRKFHDMKKLSSQVPWLVQKLQTKKWQLILQFPDFLMRISCVILTKTPDEMLKPVILWNTIFLRGLPRLDK